MLVIGVPKITDAAQARSLQLLIERVRFGLWKDPATPLPLYWAVSRLNRDFVAVATELQALTSIGAYHCGQVPQGGQALPPESRFIPDPPAQELLLGYFGKSARRPTHVLVVNLDYRKAVSTTLTGPSPMEQFHAPTRQ